MVFLLDITRACSIITMLLIGSYYDIKKREIDDWVWLLSLPALAVSLYYLYTGALGSGYAVWAVGLGIVLVLSLALYYLGLFGGADAKALVAIAASIPNGAPPFVSQIPIFALTVLDNAVVLSVFYAIILIARNLLRAVLAKDYFGRYDTAPIHVKLALLISDKSSAKYYLEHSYKLFLSEKVSVDSQGCLRFEVSPWKLGIVDDAEPFIRDLVSKGILKPQDELWVSTGLPLVVFMFLGVMLTPVLHDLVITFVKSVITF